MTERAAIEFDHHAAGLAADPWSEYERLRRDTPVAHSEAHGGFWVVSRHEDVRRIAADDVGFSSASGIVIPDKRSGQRSIPIELDPPDSHAYRRLLNPFFAPAAIERMAPAIVDIVHRCIDRIAATHNHTFDVVADLARPVPAMTTMHLLGLPVREWRTIADLQRASRVGDGRSAHARLRDTISDAISARRDAPSDDLLGRLVAARLDGRPLGDHEILDIAQLVVQGGFETTGSAISTAIVHLASLTGAERRRLVDPHSLAIAVEELLRFRAPQPALARTATRDHVVGDQRICAGEKVLLLWASANRDEAVFPDADRIDLAREPNRHLTFGVGSHRCLGSNLARAQIRATLAAVGARLQGLRIDTSRIVRADDIGVHDVDVSVPASFDRHVERGGRQGPERGASATSSA